MRDRVPPRAAKAIGYLRVSSTGQLDGGGLARQRDAIGRYAAANGFEVVEWLEDGGVSGANELDNRPALLAALALIASDGADVVIVEAEHRLARKLQVQEAIVTSFRNAGARVLTADGHDMTDDSDPMRVLMRQILGAFAEFEKATLVAKLRAERERKRAERGWCEGRAPFFGHTDAERKVVERMLRMRKQKKGYARIAAALNAAGATTRSGKPWTSRGVFNVLKRFRAVEKFSQPASAIKVIE